MKGGNDFGTLKTTDIAPAIPRDKACKRKENDTVSVITAHTSALKCQEIHYSHIFQLSQFISVANPVASST